MLPEIRPVRSFDELLARSDERHIMLVEPSQADGAPSTRSWREDAPPARATLSIGPEGGWTDKELQMASAHGFQTLDLGKRTYRIETAATVIAALLVTQ